MNIFQFLECMTEKKNMWCFQFITLRLLTVVPFNAHKNLVKSISNEASLASKSMLEVFSFHNNQIQVSILNYDLMTKHKKFTSHTLQ